MVTAQEHSGRRGDNGNLIGFIVLTGFGIIWWLMAAGQLDGSARIIEVAIGLVIVAALIARRVTSKGPEAADPAAGQRSSADKERVFRNVGIAEAVFIIAGIVACSRAGHPEWIPVWCAFVVGVHFLPLAGVFDVAAYKFTGLMFIALAVIVAAAVPILDGPEQAWFVATGLVAGLILWLTCGYLMLIGSRPS